MEMRVINKMEYRNHFDPLDQLKKCSLLILLEMFDIISCNVPRGQIDEQYTLPNRITIIKITIKPNEVSVIASIKLTADGIN
jgi:hypothetical protein